MTTTTCPWQLYVFAISNLLFGIPMVSVGIFGGDFCSFMFSGESCNEVERVYTFYVGTSALYVGVLFYILTLTNKGNTPKLNRLAMFATNCAVATFSGIIAFGSTSMGGSERPDLHITDMIWFFAVVIIMLSTMADDGAVVGSKNPLDDLKFLSPKAVVLLIGMIILVKLFVLTNFVDLFSFLIIDDESLVTALARALQNLMAILLFQVFLSAVFAVHYGDETDHKNLMYGFLGMMIVAGLSIIPMAEYFSPGLIKQGIVGLVVFLALFAFSLVQAHKDRQREGYETISTVV